MRKLFGTDGIRAVAGGSPLDPRTIFAVAGAPARKLTTDTPGHPIRVILGMDTRESGPWIAATLAEGLRADGAEIANAGVIPTPAVAYLARKHGFSAGIVISASHNPWQDNGIKIFGGDGYKLPDATELSIETLIGQQLASHNEGDHAIAAAPSTLPAVDESLRLEYIQFLL